MKNYFFDSYTNKEILTKKREIKVSIFNLNKKV